MSLGFYTACLLIGSRKVVIFLIVFWCGWAARELILTVLDGTSGVDTIDVTDDIGTLNGTPQGGPITGIDGRGSYDTITVSCDVAVNGKIAAVLQNFGT